MGDLITAAKSIPERRRHPMIRRLVDHPLFGLTIVLLILISVGLILVETFIPLTDAHRLRLDEINEGITILLAAELFLRWVVASTTSRFLGRHWIDIVALLPLLRVFRLGRMLQLLRLVRLFSLGTLIQHRLRIFSNLFQGRFTEYFILAGFMGFALIFGTVGLAQFELSATGELQTPIDAFWKAWFSLFAGEYAGYPQSLGGKLVFTLLLIFGMGAFAMLTGTFSALMIDKLKESAMQRNENPDELNGHIVICGFSAKVGIILDELAIDKSFSDCDVLLVSEHASLESLKSGGHPIDRVSTIPHDFTQIETLKKAGIERARGAIILSENIDGRTTNDVDARTILAALTIEKLHPGIHTCAELYHREYADHLKMGGVEDVVIQGDVSGRLLARLAMQQGLMSFFQDLLSHRQGNQLTFQKVPTVLVGKDISEALSWFHSAQKSIVVGHRPANGSLRVNPANIKLAHGDELLIIQSAAV